MTSRAKYYKKMLQKASAFCKKKIDLNFDLANLTKNTLMLKNSKNNYLIILAFLEPYLVRRKEVRVPVVGIGHTTVWPGI